MQADDYIFPQCLELIIQAFEQSESIGLVSSYWLAGEYSRGTAANAVGRGMRTPIFAGKDLGLWYANDCNVPVLRGEALATFLR